MTCSSDPVPDRDAGNPWRHDAAARVASRSGHSIARHGAVPTFRPGGGGAHPATTSAVSLDGAAQADPAAWLGRRYKQDQPAARRGQNGKEPAG
jgi:hypothetical protein